MPAELATGTCQICGRETPLPHHQTCHECAELIDAPRTGNSFRWSKTWFHTLVLVGGGMLAYFLAAKYLGPLYVALNIGW